ncbi:MAG TPA: hypothetical protein VN842_04370 [Thermoplasmata archaeon]|nr:hypothetical protein [Thermoplasmata archaeon]
MDGESTLFRAYSVATLSQTRAQLRNWWGRLMVAGIGAVFGLISLLVGQMLVLERIGGFYGADVIWRSSSGAYWWNYPGVILIQPWGILALPFLPTIAMALVSYGVGLGMSVAILIGARMFRLRRAGLGRPTALGSATGLTPAMIALVTLGACCSTTAAATAGIGVAAQTSGTTIDTLLQNNWYLNVLQLVILWVALIAQEQLLLAYGIFFDPDRARAASAPLPKDRYAVVKGAARLALLIGGITWSLTTIAAWTQVSAASAGAGLWFHWIVQQQAPALLAVAVALAPAGVAAFVGRHFTRPEGWVLRGLLLVGGISLIAWVPPSFVSAGIVGWVNELLGTLGIGAALGAASAAPIAGWGLVFHWAFQLLMLGALSIGVAIAPTRVLGALAPAPLRIATTTQSPSLAPTTERPPVTATSGPATDP